LGCIKKTLDNSNLNNDDIKAIVFVGGSSKITKVKEIVKNLFQHSDINDRINPDEVVAGGPQFKQV
jgi:molecular chaperone DnaK (HSP70)